MLSLICSFIYERIIISIQEAVSPPHLHIHSSRLLALKLYKTLPYLNPAFMKDYFIRKSTSYDLRRNDVLFVPKVKTTNYSIRSTSFSRLT